MLDGEFGLLIGSMLHEFEEEETSGYRRNLNMRVLAPMFGWSGEGRENDNFKAAQKSLGVALEIPSADKLFEAYRLICRSLAKKFPHASIATSSEIALWGRIEAETRLEFWRSSWIGPYCVDLFFPAIGGNPRSKPRSKGLVMEVNGPIHDHEIKGKKDTRKLSYLEELGIMVSVIENHDFNSPTVQALVRSLKSLPRISCRDRENLKNRIAIETIATHASNEMLQHLFGRAFMLLRSYLVGA